MRFDGNLAWQQAVRLFSANKELLLVLAGVFFFLPGLALAFFRSDMQLQMVRGLGGVDSHDPRAMLTAVGDIYAQVGPYMMLLSLAQMAGMMAMTALLTDAARPTVGQAIALGLRRLPTVLGVVLLFMLGYLVSAMAFGLVLALLAMIVAAVSGGAASAAMMAVVALGTDQGSKGYTMASVVISGVIGGVVSVLMTCIVCAVHGQLAGPGRESIRETFR